MSNMFSLFGLIVVLSTVFLYKFETSDGMQIVSQKVYFVADNQSACEGINSSCHSLKFYMRNTSNFFLSNTDFIFLPGDHHLDANLSLLVMNVSRLSLRGQNATVQCRNHNNNFHFHQVRTLVIENLIFSECGSVETSYSKGKAALLFTYGVDLRLSNVNVSKSVFQGVFMDNTLGNISISAVSIQDCHTNTHEIISNRAANIFYFTQCPHSSYLHIENTEFKRNSNAGFDNFTILREDDTSYSFAAGLSLVIKCDNVEVLLDNVVMDKNHGGDGGNLALIFHTTCLWKVPLVVIQNSFFTNGRAVEGGGIFVSIVQPILSGDSISNETFINSNHTILCILNTDFVGNSAEFLGGAIGIRQKESLIYRSVGDIEISNCKFIGNSLKKGGQGAIAINSINFISTEISFHVSPQFRTFIWNCSFRENFVKKNRWKSSGNAVIFLKTNSYFFIRDVTIDSNNSTAILGIESNLILSGNITLSNNKASSGGGLLLCENAVLFLERGVVVTIFNNYAEHNGGGIAVESVCLVSKPICFFQLASSNPKDYDDVHIHIYNNTANYAGDNLYGGYVENCYMIENTAHNTSANKSTSVFKDIFHIQPQGPGLPSVTSPPTHVCLCENNIPNCSITHHRKSELVYPGQQFIFELVLVGQLDGSVRGIVEAWIDSGEGYDVDKRTKFQKSGIVCENFTYAVFSSMTSGNLTMNIGAAQQGDTSVTEHLKQFRSLNISIGLSKCPKGFQLSSSLHHTSTCVCDPFFLKRSVSNCNITDNTISSPRNIWIGYVNDNTTSFIPNGYLIITPFCPAEYCQQDIVDVDLSDKFGQDTQCLHHRGGIMCGRCVEGSVKLGGPYCGECSNQSLWLLIPFALAGIFVVFFTTALNITVSDGTMNGLIFYAHIVQTQSQLLFRNIHRHPFLKEFYTIFIAWFNLEFGIEACFFNGMTEYYKAWLQFVFPLYIWLILGVIILLSRRYNIVTRLVGRNAVKIFATLILLSYPKLIRAVISSMNYTVLHVSNGETYRVWSLDGNVHFLVGKHLALLIFSAILAIICFPFTLSLLFVQILERFSHYRIFFFVRKFKPLFDAYTGPYSDKARFWTGFLLLVRIILFITSTFSDRYHTDANIIIIVALTGVILFLSSVIRPGLYENLGLHILECSSMLNLAVLFLAVAYNRFRNKSSETIFTHVSIITAFIMLVGILTFHICQKLYSFLFIKTLCARFKQRCMLRFKSKNMDSEDDDHICTDNYPPFIRFDQDREPLLAENDD